MHPLKFPRIVSFLFPSLVSKIPTDKKIIYLSFDDGPEKEVTSWVLELLQQYQAKATFFCLGKNMISNPDLVERIVQEGHQLGNHTYTHLNGWKKPHKEYLEEIEKTSKIIHFYQKAPPLFRPPYGRISPFLIKKIKKTHKIIMWTYLTGDFSSKINPKERIDYLTKRIKPGDIIVFHDSKKAFQNLQKILPYLLEKLIEKGFHFERISQ